VENTLAQAKTRISRYKENEASTMASKKKSDKKEEKLKIKYTPGFFRNGFVFEQVEGLKYAQGETTDLLEQYDTGWSDCVYQPLRRCPWLLATEPIEYVDAHSLWNDVYSFIYDHLFLPKKELYSVLTSWTLSTWIQEIWSVYPYLFFTVQ
jgi:hypothetical protein